MLIITGMHRSGTSIISQLFYKAGGNLGDFDRLYPGDKWNPDGYFEQVDILSLNISLVNGPWGKFSYFSLPSEDLIIKRAGRLKEKISEQASLHTGKIVKDPRFCLTFPAWLKYGLKPEKVIVNIREPVQVANSIKKRNHIPVKLGLKLWYEHNMRLLENIKGIPHVFLNYNSLLDPNSSGAEFRRVLNFFCIDISDEKMNLLLRENVRPSMNHNRINDFEYTGKIKQLWNDLIARYNDQRSGNI